MIRSARPRNAALLVAVLLATAGCSHLPRPHWPWHHKAAQAPEPVHELVITRADGSEAALPQYWKRNTLVVDLQSAGSEGSVVIKPRERTYWPVRIAFRVMPGQFGALEVQARQRSVLPITTTGSKPVDLELDPGVFIMKSPQIAVHWGAADQATDQSPGS
ncbi:MAG TPA: hypothetical protein VLX90_04625 [Steroidobacteraceae bacterium]|nr:hypothetical protein [Steroidobacteraceae bacterium]